MKKLLLITILFFFCYSCEKETQWTESQLVEIYASVELSPIEKASEMLKKYGLDDEKKRDAYYNALRELSTDQSKWEAFLEKVEQFHKNQDKP